MAGHMKLNVWQDDGIEARDPNDPTNSYLMPREIAEYCDPVPDPQIVKGAWWAQYSAPGYLDCTDPVMGATPEEAAQECFAMFGDDTSQEERDELAEVLWMCRKLKRAGG